MTWEPNTPFNDLPALPPSGVELEDQQVLKAAVEARVAVARLDEATDLIPNPSVLINTIPLLEAQASSEIENIVTTTDALFQAAQLDGGHSDPATKETLRYRSALKLGFEQLEDRPLTANTAADICSAIRGLRVDVRSQPGTRIANPGTGEIVYSPPEGSDVIRDKLADWERFIHSDNKLDPLVTMAVAHSQFEAIHPFSDGNGRTGRILNILILHDAGLLRQPVLYLSRYIIKHKNDYYDLLNKVTAQGAWREWVLYMLEAVQQSALSTTSKVRAIRSLQEAFVDEFEDVTPGMNNARFADVLFTQPYARIANVVEACKVSRQTAAAWLDALAAQRALTKIQVGRDRLFVNENYLELLKRTEL